MYTSSFFLQKDIRCFVSLLPLNLSYFRFFKQNGLFPLPSSLPFISSFRLWNDIRYFASSKSHLSVLLLVKVAVERAHAKNSGSNSSRMGGSVRCAIAHCFLPCTMASTCLRHASWRLTQAPRNARRLSLVYAMCETGCCPAFGKPRLRRRCWGLWRPTQ